jgi:hypothetical protein
VVALAVDGDRLLVGDMLGAGLTVMVRRTPVAVPTDEATPTADRPSPTAPTPGPSVTATTVARPTEGAGSPDRLWLPWSGQP